MRRRLAAQVFLVSMVIAGSGMAADLTAVTAEPNLEKRSEKAIGNAGTALDAARAGYQAGDREKFNAGLEELLASVELAKKSLDESGKNARRSPKYFKKAEISLRKLNLRIDNFRIEVSVEDRGGIAKILERSVHIRDELLDAIMGKQK